MRVLTFCHYFSLTFLSFLTSLVTMVMVVDVLKGISCLPPISLSSSLCLLTLVPRGSFCPFFSSFNVSPVAWRDFSSWHFKINYNIGFLTRKALLVLPPAYWHSEVHRIPGIQSTYDSLTCPTNRSLAPPSNTSMIGEPPLFYLWPFPMSKDSSL